MNGSPDLVLGRYSVEGSLGEGGLGKVILARDTRLRRQVAIKTIKRDGFTYYPEMLTDLTERFEREAFAGARIAGNPYLVTVYDLAQDTDGDLYLILEYVSGGTLKDRLEQGAIPLADALRWTLDAARGLQALHEQGIVHRDIKPANIFLAADGHAKVGDLGIAQVEDFLTRSRLTRSHPGTEAYMSPEQRGESDYLTGESDQYSLGLVLFEMLTRKRFKTLHPPQRAALLTPLPPDVAALVNRMTETVPYDRYTGMNAVIAAIEAINLTVPAAPFPILDETRPAAPASHPRPGESASDEATRAMTPAPPIIPPVTRVTLQAGDAAPVLRLPPPPPHPCPRPVAPWGAEPCSLAWVR